MQAKQCPKCAGSMAEGFVVDTSYGTMTVSGWVEGAPEKSMWTGLKLSGRARSDIVTWRCNRCGFLEQYAVATPDRSREKAERSQALLVVLISLAAVLGILGLVLVLR